MNKAICRLVGACGLVMVLAGCEPAAIADSTNDNMNKDNDSKIDLNTDLEKAAYFLGFNQAARLFADTGGVVDAQAFLAGVKDAVAENDSRVDEAQWQELSGALQAAITAKRDESSASVVSDGEKFRAEFAAQEGVTALPSGLLYEVMTEGSGAKPKLTDTVTTHYHGSLTSGEVFDSSVNRGQPASFPVNGVIAGWTEALQLMGVGSKWRLVIPPELAYGERGAGGSIPPNATLVFEVELLEIN